MNVQTITISKDHAVKVINDYKDLAAKQKTREDERLELCYKAIAENDMPVINIQTAFRETGLNDKGEPNLAISRADWSLVYFHPRSNFEEDGRHYSKTLGQQGGGGFSAKENWKLNSDKTNYVLRRNTFDNEKMQGKRLRAKVPTIPVNLRPPLHLRNYHILFEVEEWEKYAPKPSPRDPFLLKQIVGDMFIVLAEWDLTPTETMLLDAIREV